MEGEEREGRESSPGSSDSHECRGARIVSAVCTRLSLEV